MQGGRLVGASYRPGADRAEATCVAAGRPAGRFPVLWFRISPPSCLAIDSMSKRMAIVLAAGKGTRMKSDLPKGGRPVRGRPMIEFVLDALRKAGVNHLLVVVGYRADLVRQTLEEPPGRGIRGPD